MLKISMHHTVTRLTCLATCALLASAAQAKTHADNSAQQTFTLPDKQKCFVHTVAKKLVVDIDDKGRHNQIALTAPPNANLRIQPEVVHLVGYDSITKTLIIREAIHTDANPDGFCGAGDEEMLQVVSLGKVVKETFSSRLGSCVDSWEMADDGVTWDNHHKILSIHWNLKKDMEETLRYRITADGAFKQISRKTQKASN